MNDSERDFAELFEEAQVASFSQDVHEHWDLSISGLRVDVKGVKRVNRQGKKDDRFHWLEFKNVRGNKGWLYGKADIIAFECNDYWILVDRLTLVDWAEEVVTMEHAHYPLYKIKTRKGRKDIISLIKSDDLLEIGIKLDKNVFKQSQLNDSQSGQARLRPKDLQDLYVRQGKRVPDFLLSIGV